MSKIKHYEKNGKILETNGKQWFYGVPKLMNDMSSFTDEFQKKIFEEFGVEPAE